ncbi:hypothetical protein V1477_004185 [Vespula maculifrons]|uniref:Uncharacterized protein n=1 Tax=Vespula maculifrons TaxID=7453 RepID=A0ABD2CQU6_VESMC
MENRQCTNGIIEDIMDERKIFQEYTGKRSQQMCESLEYSDDRLAVITTEHACFASGTSLETSMTGSEKTELFQHSISINTRIWIITFGIGLI